MRPSADRNIDPMQDLCNELDELQRAFDHLWEDYTAVLRGTNISTPEISVETVIEDVPLHNEMGIVSRAQMPPRYLITIRDPDRRVTHRFESTTYVIESS